MVSEFEAFSQGKSSNIPELDNCVKSLGISTVFGFWSGSWFRSFGTYPIIISPKTKKGSSDLKALN